MRASPKWRWNLVRRDVSVIVAVRDRIRPCREEGHVDHPNRVSHGVDPVASGLASSLARPGDVALRTLDRLAPQIRPIELQQVEGVEESPRLRRRRRTWKAVTPLSSRHTTSPSIRQERT